MKYIDIYLLQYKSAIFNAVSDFTFECHENLHQSENIFQSKIVIWLLIKCCLRKYAIKHKVLQV